MGQYVLFPMILPFVAQSIEYHNGSQPVFGNGRTSGGRRVWARGVENGAHRPCWAATKWGLTELQSAIMIIRFTQIHWQARLVSLLCYCCCACCSCWCCCFCCGICCCLCCWQRLHANKKPLTTQLKSYIEIIHLAVLAFTYQRRVEGGAVYANALVWVLIRRRIWWAIDTNAGRR